jgi:hypothetical protein
MVDAIRYPQGRAITWRYVPEMFDRGRSWCRHTSGDGIQDRRGVEQMTSAADPNVAQARQLIGALRDQLREMAPRLARAERDAIGGHSRVARARRLEAAELRRDVSQAQLLIERLHRRFPGSDGTGPAFGTGRPSATTQADQRGNVDHVRQLNRRPHRWAVNDARRSVGGAHGVVGGSPHTSPGSPPEGGNNRLSSQ